MVRAGWIWCVGEEKQAAQVCEMGSAMEQGGNGRTTRARAKVKNVVDEKAGNEEDQRNMERVGKKPELKRGFKFLQLLAFAVILGNTAPWSLVSIAFSLENGGTAGAIYMFAIVVLFMFTVVMSMAELASMAPTAGGQYHWVSEFAPRRHQKFLSYLTGWYAVLGWQTSLVGTALAAAQLFQAAIVLYHPWFATKGWIGTLITIALTFLAASINVFAYKIFPILEGMVIPVYFAVYVALLVIFWVMGDRGGEAVFTTFSNNGWPSDSSSCLVGILGPVIVLIGSDAQAHLSEETLDAARTVPRAMISTALLNYGFGFSMVVTVMYVLGPDIEAIRNTRTGVPVVEVLLRTTGSVPATAALTCMLGLLFVCCLTNNVTTASRQLWSFARDKGIPWHEYFAKVSTTRDVPERAVGFTLGLTALLSLFNVFSSVALSTLTSLSLTGLISSYLLTVTTVLSFRLRGGRFPPSRFDLGRRFGFVCNTVAFSFLTVVLVMMFFPTTPHPQPADMNWSVVMYGAVTGVLLTFYHTRAKHFYQGPVTQVMSEDVSGSETHAC